ncbi:MAG: CPBP family intramembrane metalloprotease [Oscillatoriales cyanobacterium C42_A2020_001]|nr:CPBP family intramembrane metalloprotease [Leptolyngbyaceae cyanobacterium C42_A2020_001]
MVDASVSGLVARMVDVMKLPNLREWGITLWVLLGYAAIALPIGFSQGFLQVKLWDASGWRYTRMSVQLLVMPSFVEELIFRVLLLPSPAPTVLKSGWIIWAIASLIVFVICHPLNAKTLYKAADPTFFNPIFLTLAALLGLACTVAYFLTGSLLAITLIHWVAVVIWLMALGGMEKLDPHPSESS